MGINLELILSTVNSETNEIVFESELIFNGVFVKCKGKINKQTLFGTIFLEFDAEKAESETQKNSEALKMYKTRIDAIQNYLSS
uniref:Uncharacterized protein n=1 Tax=Panagrolaimus sp. JU765 TaxID=591449 RepID=A0AC34R5U3_9BILA